MLNENGAKLSAIKLAREAADKEVPEYKAAMRIDLTAFKCQNMDSCQTEHFFLTDPRRQKNLSFCETSVTKKFMFGYELELQNDDTLSLMMSA